MIESIVTDKNPYKKGSMLHLIYNEAITEMTPDQILDKLNDQEKEALKNELVDLANKTKQAMDNMSAALAHFANIVDVTKTAAVDFQENKEWLPEEWIAKDEE